VFGQHHFRALFSGADDFAGDQEVRRAGAELAAVGDQVAGSEFQAAVAILKDYENEWDGELDAWLGPLERSSTAAWFTALQRRHIPVDVVFLSATTSLDSLLKYKVLIYSHPAIISDGTAALLAQYTARGGDLILGCRSGLKEPTGRCRMARLPGPLAELCGVSVEDFTLIGSEGESERPITAGGRILFFHTPQAAAQALAATGATAYLGELTRAALAEFQASVGISPALGNFGPVTRVYVGAHY